MVKSSRVLGYLGVFCCLLWPLFACASEGAPGEDVSTAADSGGMSLARATATPTSVTPTLSVKALVPLPTLVQEEGEMMPTANVSPGLEKLVDQAMADLAERLNIDSANINLVAAQLVEWPDASLSCPQPGMVYAQVITPGFRVVLEAKGETFEYHTDTGRLIALCREGGSPTQLPIPIDPDEIKDGKPWMPVD